MGGGMGYDWQDKVRREEERNKEETGVVIKHKKLHEKYTVAELEEALRAARAREASEADKEIARLTAKLKEIDDKRDEVIGELEAWMSKREHQLRI